MNKFGGSVNIDPKGTLFRKCRRRARDKTH